ncbi:MAG TPA: hypothetical protein VK730_08780 [Solirubrobacteraceae bacterium]|jgi:hypothetical protein|nr:hypothetical protein [Solirubrobacteraceae bacterium]
MRGTMFKHARVARVAFALVGASVLLAWAQAAFADTGPRTSAPAPADGMASLGIEQCVTSTVQAERSATFTAQMTATAATQKMAMRIELQQRSQGESEFHNLAAPGFGVWRTSEPGVEIYKYVKQVTNLDAPAAYRVMVRFRWIDERGHVFKRDELHTSRCVQPTLPGQVTQTPPTTGS